MRIVGGTFRGRRLEFLGDPRTRPMKDRVREAVFNLLGRDVAGRLVLDLFAGTGALGLEALSRGAVRAILIERHFPTAESLKRNAAMLGCQERVEVVASDTFFWSRRLPVGDIPWLVFCSPPYALYEERQTDMLNLITSIWEAMPEHSTLVVEFDERFDPGLLPSSGRWERRDYPPARVAIGRRPSAAAGTDPAEDQPAAAEN